MARTTLAIFALVAVLFTGRADAQEGVQRVVFWGLLAHDAKLTQNQWIPMAIYPDAQSAEAASVLLRRHGLTGKVLQGYANSFELSQHARTAEHGRAQLQRLLQKDQLAAIQEDFRRSGQTNREGQIDRPSENTNRNTVERAGFDQRRRQTIENAGFDPFRRNTINTARFPIAPQGQAAPTRGVRGTFGTQAGQRLPNTARGNFGTQPQQQAAPRTNNPKGAFGTR